MQIYGNYIHDFDQYYVCNAWHRDGIHVWARPESAQLTIDNVEIYGNYFEDNTSQPGSTAWIYLEYACRNFKIHHNVMHNPRAYFAIRILGDGFLVAGNNEISNNVIYNVAMGYALHVQESTGTKLYNNIFYTSSLAYSIHTDSMTGFASDYNLFYLSSGTQVVALNAGPANNIGGTRYTLAQLQSQTTYDQHSLYGNPLFGSSPAAINSDPLGFKPTAASPSIDKGTGRGFTADFSGVPIPQGAGPDIGAFEYTTGVIVDGPAKKDAGGTKDTAVKKDSASAKDSATGQDSAGKKDGSRQDGAIRKDAPVQTDAPGLVDGVLARDSSGETGAPAADRAAAGDRALRPGSDGCGCVVAARPSPGGLLVLAAVVALVARRRRPRR